MSRLLIAHGSPDARHHQTMERVATAAQARDGVPTRVGYLEHDNPSVRTVARELAQAASPSAIGALGLLLSDGYHARVDLPAVLADASATVTLSDHIRLTDHGTLGMGPWLIPALERNVREVEGDSMHPEFGVVLVAAGSAEAQAREQVVQLASAWQRERAAPVRPAFAAGPGPTLDEALGMLTDAGCTRRAVSLLMLAPGVLADRIVDNAAARAVPVAQPIGLSPEVVSRIVDQLRS